MIDNLLYNANTQTQASIWQHSYETIFGTVLLIWRRRGGGKKGERLTYAAHVIAGMWCVIIILLCLVSVTANHHILHLLSIHLCILKYYFILHTLRAVRCVARPAAGCCLFRPSGCPGVGPWGTTYTGGHNISFGWLVMLPRQSGLLYHAAQSLFTQLDNTKIKTKYKQGGG